MSLRYCFLPFIRRDHALRDKSTVIIRANAQKILPRLIPALVAALRGLEGNDEDASGGATLAVVDGRETVGDAFAGEAEEEGEEDEDEDEDEDEEGEEGEEGEEVEEKEDENETSDNEDDGKSVVATTVEEIRIVDDAVLVEIGDPPSKLISDRPHVCAATASFDVISNVGVLAQSSPEKSSSCIWQMPLSQ